MVVFHALDEKYIAGIVRTQLAYLEKRLMQLEMGLVVEDSARAIQQQLENQLAKAILEGKFAAKDVIRVGAVGGVIKFGKG